MGERGPSGRPTEMRLLHGERKDRINRNEPKPPPLKQPPRCPPELQGEARRMFRRLARDLFERRMLTEWDVPLLKSWCIQDMVERRAYEAWGRPLLAPVRDTDGAVMLGEDGTPLRVEIAPAFSPVVPGYRGAMVRHPALVDLKLAAMAKLPISKRFGFTPSDRAGIEMPRVPPEKAREFMTPKRVHGAPPPS